MFALSKINLFVDGDVQLVAVNRNARLTQKWVSGRDNIGVSLNRSAACVVSLKGEDG